MSEAAPVEGGRRHKGSRKSRRGTRKGTRKQSPWMQHVMKTKSANRGKPLSEVLVIASETYKKTGGGVAETASPLKGGKKTRRTRKH